MGTSSCADRVVEKGNTALRGPPAIVGSISDRPMIRPWPRRSVVYSGQCGHFLPIQSAILIGQFFVTELDFIGNARSATV
jgi:hypothetical protein